MVSFLMMLGASSGLAFLTARLEVQYFPGIIPGTFAYLVILGLSYVTWAIVLYPRFADPLRHLPEAPDRDFFLGHTKHVVREPSGWPARKWISTVPNNGLIRYSLWFRRRILLTTTSALSEVLVTKNYDFVKPAQIRKTLGQILGIGILFAEGDEHKTQRKNLSPAFSYRHVKDIYPIFWQKSIEMVDCMSAAIAAEESAKTSARAESDALKTENKVPKHDPGVIEVGDWSSRATLDIIGLCGMGQDFNSLRDPDNKLSRTYQAVTNPNRSDRILQVASLIFPFWLLKLLPIQRNSVLDSASKYVKQVCRDSILRKRKGVADKGNTGVDILSVAMESGMFSDEDLVNQMMTFLIAGHETTATAMTWAIYSLCRYPEMQQKLRQEIRSKIPSLKSEITSNTIDECHYLQAVCSETLRLWAPVGLTSRVAACDTSIVGEFIPKGTPVILAPATINTSPELWGPDAFEFKPERWITDGKANNQGSAKSNFAFLTFLHGPRSCIGQRFAQAEFACILAAWIGRFDTAFERGSDLAAGKLDVKGGITSKPKGGVWCTVKEVQGW